VLFDVENPKKVACRVRTRGNDGAGQTWSLRVCLPREVLHGEGHGIRFSPRGGIRAESVGPWRGDKPMEEASGAERATARATTDSSMDEGLEVGVGRERASVFGDALQGVDATGR